MSCMAKPAAGQQHRQMGVGIAHTGAMQHHRLVEQRALSLAHLIETHEEFAQQGELLFLNAPQFLDHLWTVAMMRERVRFVRQPLTIGGAGCPLEIAGPGIDIVEHATTDPLRFHPLRCGLRILLPSA